MSIIGRPVLVMFVSSPALMTDVDLQMSTRISNSIPRTC